VSEGSATNLSVVVQTDSEVSPTYQWKKGGVDVPGANAATLAFGVPVQSDSGQYSVVVTIPGVTNTATSSAATLTVKPAVFAVGFLKDEYWTGKNKAAVEGGTAGNPDTGYPQAIRTFEIRPDKADNYAERISGFFIPPTTGDYVFNVSADDTADL